MKINDDVNIYNNDIHISKAVIQIKVCCGLLYSFNLDDDQLQIYTCNLY